MNELLKDILPQLYSDLAQPPAKEAGRILANAISFIGIPFAGMGFLGKVADVYFEKNLLRFSEKMSSIPKEDRQEPLPEIAVPILQRMYYTTTEEIAELFNSLLVGASDIRQQHNVFPSFSDIVSQLSVDEARIITYLKNKEAIGYCVLRERRKNGNDKESQTSYHILHKKVSLLFEDNLILYLSDLVRMGILEESIFASSLNLPEFDEIPQQFSFEKIKQEKSLLGYEVSHSNHAYYVTEYGESFINACTYNPKLNRETKEGFSHSLY